MIIPINTPINHIPDIRQKVEVILPRKIDLPFIRKKKGKKKNKI